MGSGVGSGVLIILNRISTIKIYNNNNNNNHNKQTGSGVGSGVGAGDYQNKHTQNNE